MNTATIRVVCTSCGSKLDIRTELAGSKRRCPNCKTEFVVPSDEDTDDDAALAEESDPNVEAPLKTPGPRAVSDDPLPQAVTPESPEPTVASDADDDDEDYIPSFVTASVRKDEAETPLPPTNAGAVAKEDNDQEILSIPNVPPPSKPKFKSFDDAFEDDEDDGSPPRSTSRQAPKPAARESGETRKSSGRREPLGDEFDIDEPSPPPKSRGSTRSPNLSDASIPTPSPTRDRAAAARELRQALKDSSLREAPQQPTRGGFNIDFSGLGSDIGLKGLAIIVGTVVLIPVAIMIGRTMMGGNGLKIPPLGYVTGTVTYNGQPAVNATVRFMPVPDPTVEGESTNFNNIRTSTGQTNEKGEYELIYIEGVRGARIGKCRVWIELEPPLVAPGDFSPAGNLLRDVKSGSQTYDFSMTAQAP